MKTELTAKERNHVVFTLRFDPEELKALCGGTTTADVVQTLIWERCNEALEELGWKAAAPPVSEFSGEALTATVTVTCMPVLEERHYKGIVLARTKGASTSEDGQARLRAALIDKLIETADFDLPQSMYESEVRMLVCGLSQQMKYDAMAHGRFLDPLDDSISQRMQEIEEEAVKRVKSEIILNAIIQAEHLDVTREELEAEAEAISIRQEMPIEMVKDFLGADLAGLRQDVLVNKALDLVMAHAVLQ